MPLRTDVIAVLVRCRMAGREDRIMAEERLLADVLRDIQQEQRSGALYISMVETSEDLLRIYFEKGRIYHLQYGSASDRECLDILEYYKFYSSTYFDGIKAPGSPHADLPPTAEIIEKFTRMNKTVKIR
jgi:hypothetical protein